MREKNQARLHGARFGFVQGGQLGHRLVLLTPPVKAIWHGQRLELLWNRSAKPFRYEAAPIVAWNKGKSDFPKLFASFAGGNRTTCEGNFSSAFRSRTSSLTAKLAAEVDTVFSEWPTRSKERQIFARRYEETIPGVTLGPKDRREIYLDVRAQAGALVGKKSSCGPRRWKKRTRVC